MLISKKLVTVLVLLVLISMISCSSQNIPTCNIMYEGIESFDEDIVAIQDTTAMIFSEEGLHIQAIYDSLEEAKNGSCFYIGYTWSRLNYKKTDTDLITMSMVYPEFNALERIRDNYKNGDVTRCFEGLFSKDTLILDTPHTDIEYIDIVIKVSNNSVIYRRFERTLVDDVLFKIADISDYDILLDSPIGSYTYSDNVGRRYLSVFDVDTLTFDVSIIEN